MIRQMVRRRIVALSAILGTLSTGAPPLVAAAPNGRPGDDPAASQWYLQVLDDSGHVRPLQNHTPQTYPGAAGTMPSADELKRKRQQIAQQANSPDPETAASAKRALVFLDLATAKTAAQRHDLIQRLSVTMTTQPSSDGRSGVVKSFAVRGKTRLRWFVPSEPAAPAGETPPSGPAAAEATGLSCEGETESDPCATEQEMNDYMAFLAAAQAEADAAQAEYDAANAGLDAAAMEMVSGPAACELGCESEAFWAGAGVTSALFTTGYFGASAAGTVAAGATLTVGAIAGGVVVVGAAIGFAWYAVREYRNCARGIPKLLGVEYELPLSEPAY
jgi:hypothetical protein